VQEGDTLSAIAGEFGVTVDAIAEASGLADVDTLEVGQRLVIPGVGGDVVPVSDEPSSGEPAAALSETYVVQDGDTLSSIASEFGVSVEEISSTNGMSDVDFLSIGQELQIPSGTSASGPDVAAAQTAPVGAAPAAGEYVVVEGDTLSSIAEAHDTDVETLQSLNGIDDPSFINVGDSLLLP